MKKTAFFLTTPAVSYIRSIDSEKKRGVANHTPVFNVIGFIDEGGYTHEGRESWASMTQPASEGGRKDRSADAVEFARANGKLRLFYG